MTCRFVLVECELSPWQDDNRFYINTVSYKYVLIVNQGPCHSFVEGGGAKATQMITELLDCYCKGICPSVK